MTSDDPEYATDADTAPIAVPQSHDWALALDAVAFAHEAVVALEAAVWDLPKRPHPLTREPMRTVPPERYVAVVRLVKVVKQRLEDARTQLEPSAER